MGEADGVYGFYWIQPRSYVNYNVLFFEEGRVAGVGRGAREKGRQGRGGEGRKKEGRRERKIFLLPKDFEITNNRLCPTQLL